MCPRIREWGAGQKHGWRLRGGHRPRKDPGKVKVERPVSKKWGKNQASNAGGSECEGENGDKELGNHAEGSDPDRRLQKMWR